MNKQQKNLISTIINMLKSKKIREKQLKNLKISELYPTFKKKSDKKRIKI